MNIKFFLGFQSVPLKKMSITFENYSLKFSLKNEIEASIIFDL